MAASKMDQDIAEEVLKSEWLGNIHILKCRWPANLLSCGIQIKKFTIGFYKKSRGCKWFAQNHIHIKLWGN